MTTDSLHPVLPAPASTVVLLRESAAKFEVLLVRRLNSMKFFGGAYVFPGGRVDPGDGTDLDSRHRAAAARELREEAGISVEPSSLMPFARWITPEREPKRFDALFYLAELPRDQHVRPGQSEIADSRWLTPAAALELAERDEIRLPPPTWVTLDTLSSFTSISAAIDGLWSQQLLPTRPEIDERDGLAVLTIPGRSVTFTLTDGRWLPQRS